MRTKRQNIQLELALEPEAKGEARSAGGRGTEARMAFADSERRRLGGLCPMPSGRLNPSNRRVRTRMHGGVGGVEPRGSPLSRLISTLRGISAVLLPGPYSLANFATCVATWTIRASVWPGSKARP